MRASVQGEIDGARGSGQPLDGGARARLERTLGESLGALRIHADDRAASLARAVSARAFAVGDDVFFGAGLYRPGTADGDRLIVHEAVHTLQQRSAPAGGPLTVSQPGDVLEREAKTIVADIADAPAADATAADATAAISMQAAGPPRRELARACLPATECAGKKASLTELVQEAEANPVTKTKADTRRADCAAHRPACTSDGHAAEATALTAFLRDRSPERLNFVSGLFINKDISPKYGAVTVDCASFSPPLPINGGKEDCTTVPDALEAEANLYMNTTTPTIGGVDRYAWVTQTLQTLTHETEHGRFGIAADDPATTPLSGPATAGCAPSDVESDLSEVAAQMSEFPIVLRRSQILTPQQRDAAIARFFRYHLTNKWENVTGTLETLRCKCECSDVDNYVRQVANFSQATWTSYEKFAYNTEMKKPEHMLNWPVDPPATVDFNDLPSSIPLVDIKDLPDIPKKP